MTNEQKATALLCILPVCADIADDLIYDKVFIHETKQYINKLTHYIRVIDKQLMNNAPQEDIDNQIGAQRELRQWIKENF